MRATRLFAAVVLLASALIVALPADVARADENVAAIAAGGDHTCAITDAGGVKCWGYNAYGQLGDGESGDDVFELAPVDVSGLGSGVVGIAGGGEHTCALTTGGGVKCWGLNQYGELGDGSFNQSNVPVDVAGLTSGVAAIAAGGLHTCALTTAGAVKCWGYNGLGELGNGSTVDQSTPASVTGLGSGVLAIGAGSGTSCAITVGGAAKCWGDNANGQLGDGTTTERHTPVAVSGLGSGVSAITVGDLHTCALTSDGALQCWGDNAYGELGDGTTTERHTPVGVDGFGSDATSVAAASVTAGGDHTCAITSSGGAECWGRNLYGQLGNASMDRALTPMPVAGLGSGVAAISTGDLHTCALSLAAEMRCWGYNGEGQLGDGTSNRVLVPTQVFGLDSGVAAIGAGYHHTCAITTDGGLKCWGDNSAGQLGDGTTLERDTPFDVAGLGSGVAAVTAGYDHTCALTTDGAVKCWGDNAYGQLGDGTTTDRHTPVTVSGLGSNIAAITAGVQHTCALTTGGAVKCWGYNHDGELGDHSNTQRHVPVAVTGLGSGVDQISAGGSNTCALTSGGAVKCWGAPGLGDGTTSGSNVPVGVSGLASGVAEVSGGGFHICARTTAGGLQCWGDGSHGELGNGTTTTFESTPVDVSGFASGATALALAASHTCTLTTGGGVKCWGYNEQGEVGDGSEISRSTPVDVSGLTSGVASITAEGDHSCAVTTAGGVECWGVNANGQIGNGTSGQSTVPVGVVGLGLNGAAISSAPAIVSAAAHDGAATVSWTPPTDNGGASVYGYAITVTKANGGVPSDVTGPRVRTTSATTFRFSGLSNGSSYRLNIAPINRAGIGVSILSSIVRPHGAAPPPVPPPPTRRGYWMVGATGSAYAFGHVSNYGRASTSAVVHIEPTPTGRGYWIVDASGSVFHFGDAKRFSGAGTLSPGEYVSSLSSTKTGHGYWLFTNRGRVINRGDARFFGDLRSTTLNGSIVGSVATPTGAGYYMVGSDGGVFTFGDAKFRGSTGSTPLNQPVQGLVPTRNGKGYWLVASDGGVFAFNAPFRGSMGATALNQPIIGMVRYGNGYLMAASDGGVFDFSNVPFAGSLGAHPPPQPIVSIAATG